MRFVKVLAVYIIVLAMVVSAFAENNVVSVSDNSINISSQEYANCRGAICDYTFTLINLGTENKKVNISNIFYNSNVIPLKLERYGLIEEDVQVNNPYICNQTIDANGTAVDVYCDNFTTETISSYGYSEIPSNKYDGLRTESSQWIMLHKDSENTFKATVFLPLGQKSKFDIVTDNDDGTKTTLDPWVDTNTYYVNLTKVNQNLVSYWGADTTGSLLDSLNKNNGTISGATYTTQGKLNGAYDFSSTNDVINISDSSIYAFGTNNFTIAMWLKPVVHGSGSQCFIAKQNNWADSNGWYFCIDSISLFFGRYNGGGGTFTRPSGSMSAYNNTWVHVVAVINYGTNVTFYLNGTQQTNSATLLTSWASFTNTQKITIGDETALQSGYDGLIDEIAIYNKALNSSEVSMLYNLGAGLSFPNMLQIPITTSIENQNLTINSTNSGVFITYDLTIINQINDTALGDNLMSGTCYPLISGKTSLNWSISANINYSKDMSRVINYTFTDCVVNESLGLQAILEGVSASKVGNAYTSYDNKNVYIRLANTSQYQGAFDKFVVIGNKRYAFNYDPNSTASFYLMYNITPVFYVWQNYNMSYYQIKNGVTDLIDSTN